MHNAITAANFETRQALHQSYQMNELLEREPDFISESATRRIESSADRVLKYLLMCDEFTLTDSVAGTSTFAKEFASMGPRDPEQRSLRDFDLETRLFRYPCSYLIYSDSFMELPAEVKSRVLEKLKHILSGEDQSEAYQHLTGKMRSEILEILRATHPDFQ